MYPGQWYSYNVTQDNSAADCGSYAPCWLDRSGGTVLGFSNFPTSAFPTPWNVQMFGETHYYTSDVPGSSRSVQYFNPQYLGTDYQIHQLQYYYGNDTGNSYFYRQTSIITSCVDQPGTPCWLEWDGLSGTSPLPQ